MAKRYADLEAPSPDYRAEIAVELITPRQGSVLSMSRQGFHQIAYTEWGDPDAEETALCVHGLTRQGRDFDSLAVSLVKRGYRVVCPDLAGRGRSDWLRDPEDYNLPQYASDLTAVIARLGVKTLTWIGTSLGGLIGMTVASQVGTPVRKLVINDIGPFLPHSALHRLGLNLRHMPDSFPSYLAAESYFRDVLSPFGDLTDSQWQQVTQYSISRESDGTYRMLCDPGIARVFRPVFFYNVSLWRYWDAIECPVLLLRGEQSDLLPADLAATMCKRGPRPDYMEIHGCGHAPALLDEAQVDAVTGWVAGSRAVLPA